MLEQKPLTPPTRVCLRLRELREAKKLSLDDVATRTKIAKQYLASIEACRFDDIPFATVYKKNFVHRFAVAVGADPTPFVTQFLEEEEEAPAPTSMPRRASFRFQNLPDIFRSVMIGGIVLLVVGYLGNQVKHIVDPPTLTLHTPQDGYVADDQSIIIEGQAVDAAKISINGQPITNGDNGEFKETVTLSPGMNTITISAQKRHGKTTTELRHVILKEHSAFSYKP